MNNRSNKQAEGNAARFNSGDVRNRDVGGSAGGRFRIDISRFYLQIRTSERGRCGSLAGVSGLNGGAPGITEATNRAVTAMNKYDFNNTGVTSPRQCSFCSQSQWSIHE